MEKDLKYILTILKGRFEDPKMVFGFDVEFHSEKNDWWEATVRYGIPETCASTMYIGTGDDVIEAVEKCIKKVLLDERLETEIG